MMEKFFIIAYFCLLVTIFPIFINIANAQEEEEGPIIYRVHFDFDRNDPNITLIDLNNKSNPNPEIKDIESEYRSVFIPRIELDKVDYFFSGWTEDGIYGFEPGNVFLCTHKNCTLKPVFGLLADKRTFTLEYIIEFEGEIIESNLNKGHYCKNRKVTTSMLSINTKKAVHRGWTDGEYEFAQEQKLVMPEHNVTLRALYFYYRNLTYLPGDVDGLVGVTSDIQVIRYRGDIDLAEETRLKRNGYTIAAWHCENDGKDYPIFYKYIMPDENVIMTAIWEPLNYNIVFRSGVSSIPDLKIRARTGEIIIAPNVDEREGYTFRGWVIYQTEVYFPGDEIVVKGQAPGLGIGTHAIWIQN